jgi:hypothetical protein
MKTLDLAIEKTKITKPEAKDLESEDADPANRKERKRNMHEITRRQKEVHTC